MIDFHKKFDQLSPTMRWQFNTKAQGYLAPYGDSPVRMKQVLQSLFIELETADRLKDILLKENLTADEMYLRICMHVKTLPEEHMQSGTMGKLAGALTQGDNLVYRLCLFWQRKGLDLKTLRLEHPCLIQDEKDYQKWLTLLSRTELSDFHPGSGESLEPYRIWATGTDSGKSFEERRCRYFKAVRTFVAKEYPHRRLPCDTISRNGYWLLNQFVREKEL